MDLILFIIIFCSKHTHTHKHIIQSKNDTPSWFSRITGLSSSNSRSRLGICAVTEMLNHVSEGVLNPWPGLPNAIEDEKIVLALSFQLFQRLRAGIELPFQDLSATYAGGFVQEVC